MAKRMIFTCDNCGAETQDINAIWELQIRVFSLGGPTNHPSNSKNAHWCRPCVEQIHLLPPIKTPAEKLPLPPTFEEMLRAIIREEVEDLTGAAE